LPFNGDITIPDNLYILDNRNILNHPDRVHDFRLGLVSSERSRQPGWMLCKGLRLILVGMTDSVTVLDRQESIGVTSTSRVRKGTALTCLVIVVDPNHVFDTGSRVWRRVTLYGNGVHILVNDHNSLR
jgi:hypothetical protein